MTFNCELIPVGGADAPPEPTEQQQLNIIAALHEFEQVLIENATHGYDVHVHVFNKEAAHTYRKAEPPVAETIIAQVDRLDQHTTRTIVHKESMYPNDHFANPNWAHMHMRTTDVAHFAHAEDASTTEIVKKVSSYFDNLGILIEGKKE